MSRKPTTKKGIIKHLKAVQKEYGVDNILMNTLVEIYSCEHHSMAVNPNYDLPIKPDTKGMVRCPTCGWLVFKIDL
jgi:hypothetical protein